MVNGGKLKSLSLKSNIRQDCSLLFHISLEILAIAIRQERDIKTIQTGKEKANPGFCTYHDSLITKPKIPL